MQTRNGKQWGRPPTRTRRVTVVVTRTVKVCELDRPDERMRRWLHVAGITREVLAARMGLRTGHAISMLWQRAGITEPVFLRLCAAMEVEPGWWLEPFERWRRPPRGIVLRRIDQEAAQLADRIKKPLPAERRGGRTRP